MKNSYSGKIFIFEPLRFLKIFPLIKFGPQKSSFIVRNNRVLSWYDIWSSIAPKTNPKTQIIRDQRTDLSADRSVRVGPTFSMFDVGAFTYPKMGLWKVFSFFRKLVISDILSKKENLYSRNVTVDSVSVQEFNR